jgi:hypothetical protein
MLVDVNEKEADEEGDDDRTGPDKSTELLLTGNANLIASFFDPSLHCDVHQSVDAASLLVGSEAVAYLLLAMQG